MLLLFAIVHYVMMLRKWITETKLGMMGKLSEKRRGEDVSAERGHIQMESVSTKAEGVWEQGT